MPKSETWLFVTNTAAVDVFGQDHTASMEIKKKHSESDIMEHFPLQLYSACGHRRMVGHLGDPVHKLDDCVNTN